MKTIITIFTAIILSTTLATASTAPKLIVSDSEIEIVTGSLESLFVDADFNAETQNLSFQTKSEMTYVQIMNSEGVLEFQLPVNSNSLKINKNLFSEGNYKLGFIFKGDKETHFTNVQIK